MTPSPADSMAGTGNEGVPVTQVDPDQAQDLGSLFTLTSPEKDYTVQPVSPEVEAGPLDPKGWSVQEPAGFLDTVPELESDLA